MGLVEQIQAWYAAQCDGGWEHQYGVSIETLDNPGWCVMVDLSGTSLENISFQTYQEDGRGDPFKLQTILEIFVSLIGKQP